jgi:Family of unknown function (DUF6776)
MRWRLLRRRLSISAPRMIVRSHLPWPLRWAVVGLSLGFSAAIGLWAFQFGKDIAGLDRPAKAEMEQLKAEIAQLRSERDKAQSIANTAESLLKAGTVAQERLAEQVRQIEAEKLELKADLGFFQRLLPAAVSPGLAVRALQAELKAPGKTRYQLLVMQTGNVTADFVGRYEIVLAGTLDGRAWSTNPAKGGKPLQLRQYARVEGLIDHPVQAVVKTVQVRVTDQRGQVVASLTVKT